MADLASFRPIARRRLVDRVLARREPVVLIEAAPGMGKSLLLMQIAERLGVSVHARESAPDAGDGRVPVLWDIPPGSEPEALPEPFVAGAARIVVAKRPHTRLRGLSRAAAYGHAFSLDAGDLLFDRDEIEAAFGTSADAVLEESGGWPLLVARFAGSSPDGGVMRRFLQEELLEPLTSAELVDLRALVAGGTVRADGDDLVPLVRRDGEGKVHFVAESVREPIAGAVERLLADRTAIPAEAKAIAEAHAARGEMTEAIVAYQNAGFHDLALRTFAAAHGRFFIYLYGPAALDRVLAGFPTSFAMQSETIIMGLAVQSLKRGDVSLARRLLADRFGDAANDPDEVFSPKSVFSREFRSFRLVMLIYEDVFFTEELLENIFAMLAEYPADAHFLRGSFYNSVLEFYLRSRRFAEAEDLAQRAHFHYERAGAPLLSFYISLHQAIMRMMMGDALSARTFAADARRSLDKVGFDSPNDRRLLVLLNACIDYEGGKAEPLARFLSLELEGFSHGEIWPSLIEFALLYGSQALSEHFSTIAARGFLDRWRVFQIRNRQFRNAIELREAAILQNANRWQEAADKLASIASFVGRSWVLAAGEELARLHERDDIGLALLWLRQHVHEMPTRPELAAQLAAMRQNLHLTERQRIGLDIWMAYVAKRSRDLGSARAILQKTFESAARLGAMAPLAEERDFLGELLATQRIADFLDTSGPSRQVLRRLRDGLVSVGALGRAGNLSRRETKVLLMAAEGAANKFIANTLGLSEATVKFHLGNVYRKLGCRSRREAIAAARAMGLVT
jgi:DNA-binding CsgD family transcriptional regulator